MATFTNIRLGMRTKNSLASSPTPRKLYQSERVTQTAEIEKLIRSASHLVQEAVYARLSRLDSSHPQPRSQRGKPGSLWDALEYSILQGILFKSYR